MFVSPPAHTKIFRILGEKRLCGVEDVTLWRSWSGFVVTLFFSTKVNSKTTLRSECFVPAIPKAPIDW